MAVEIREIKYEAPSKVSRYAGLRGYLTSTNAYLENYKKIEIPEDKEDKYFLVVSHYIDRIDLIAHKFYNDSKMWWVIAVANNMDNPMEVPINTVLRIPSISTLYGRGGVLENA